MKKNISKEYSKLLADAEKAVAVIKNPRLKEIAFAKLVDSMMRKDEIKNISKNLWTDYNVHDPGVTLLEVLYYAITDLAYRTGFPIEDLLKRNEECEKRKTKDKTGS